LVIRIFAWFGLWVATGLLVRGEVRRPEPPHGVEVYRDLVYRVSGNRKIRLDLYGPQGTAPAGGRPVIVAIHGGGWRGGSKLDMQGMAVRFAQRGYVIAAVDYRLSRPSYSSWPDNLSDVREAVRWLRRHAKDYGIDPDRVVALGSSAGGHLAALLGTTTESPVNHETYSGTKAETKVSSRVQAVVDLYGPSDLEMLYRHSPLGSIPVVLMMGATPDTAPRRYRSASPVSHVTSEAPPMLLIHGRQDTLVPPEQSESLAQKLQASGVAHRLLVIDGARHGFPLDLADRDLLPEIVSFLNTVWTGRPDPKKIRRSSH